MKLLQEFDKQEQATFTDMVATALVRDCKPYLKEIKQRADIALYRGMRQRGDFEEVSIRKNRKPLHTFPKIQKLMDEWFKDNFGYAFRSGGLFAVGDPTAAKAYGVPHAVFPIGKFRYIWSAEEPEVYFGASRVREHGIDPNKLDDVSDDELEEMVFDTLDGSGYQTDDLAMAIKNFSGHEVMIGGGEYYAIPFDLYKKHGAAIFKKVRALM